MSFFSSKVDPGDLRRPDVDAAGEGVF